MADEGDFEMEKVIIKADHELLYDSISQWETADFFLLQTNIKYFLFFTTFLSIDQIK